MTTIKQYRLLALVGKRSGKLLGDMGRDWHSTGRNKTSQNTRKCRRFPYGINTNCSSAIGNFETVSNDVRN